jgi:hypothetical protein
MKTKNFFKLCLTILIFISAFKFFYAQQPTAQAARRPPAVSGGFGISSIGPSEFIIFFLILLFFASIGLTIIASGQLFLAIREIAFNTRKEKSEETNQYKVLFLVAKVNNFLGWLIIIFGFIGAWFLARLI